MRFSYFDDSAITEAKLASKAKVLNTYREFIANLNPEDRPAHPEYSLTYPADYDLYETLEKVKKDFKAVKHLVLVGIGGSSLGTEAIYAALGQNTVSLTVLDTIAPYKLHQTLIELKKVKNPKHLAVCVISKSGGTTETLANASVLLAELEAQFSAEKLYSQVIFIGDEDSALATYAKKVGSRYLAMPKIIGGRYSVATAVGLVPLAILGYNTDDFTAGYLDSGEEKYEIEAVASAVRLALYHGLKYPHYNFFAFDPRLEKLGAWYRQLMAESLGKETDITGKIQKFSLVPSLSTPIELHSTSQLYLSGTAKTYTDFISLDDTVYDFKIPKTSKLATSLKKFSHHDIATALYGGVIGAYQSKKLPYRATIFEDNLLYSLGLFMGIRLREVMYTAKLLKLNAFDQPNVELYKIKTKEILGI